MIKNYFRPEFLNRIDEIIVFNALTLEQVSSITGILLTKLNERLENQLNITLLWDEAALTLLAKEGYDPSFGARPLRRQISQSVETKLSKMLVHNQITEGNKVKLEVLDGSLSLKKVPLSTLEK